MKNVKSFLLHHPIISTGLIIAASLLIILGTPFLVSLEGLPKTFLKAGLRLLIVGAMIVFLVRLDWFSQAGLTGQAWRPRWWIATLPMLLIVTINLLGVDWSAVAFTPGATAGWLSYNISVGLFEEILLRGLCFCILLQAWKDRSNGILLAALVQAAIFGLLHLINLVHQPVLDTVAQTLYATLLGIGFAGLTIHCRSLWPAILVHTAINLAGSMNIDLVPGAVESGGSLSGYLVAMVVITLVSTLPGLWMLRREMKSVDIGKQPLQEQAL